MNGQKPVRKTRGPSERGWASDLEIRGAVLRLAADPNADVRWSVASALARVWPDDRVARDALARLAADQYAVVRQRAAELLNPKPASETEGPLP
ncbi:HEAT repeat domain-containing protein [Streptomyces sp. NPDC004680]|uniref:HEAT repeat domain-containing protein n=1 Tax=Streptomyces sp. NPDC004680 TaxID=3154287 RepID=UPI0033AFEB86